VSGRISKIGDRGVRATLYEAAHIILTRPVKAGALKSWAMRLAARAGKNKAKVALARKLAAARTHQPAMTWAYAGCRLEVMSIFPDCRMWLFSSAATGRGSLSLVPETQALDGLRHRR
jgi:hypothetical protein